MTPAQELQAWHHWREQCALALIDEAERMHLTGVIARRFGSRIRKLGAAGLFAGTRPVPPSDPECAHLFETHLALHQRRDGKSYKHWLLTRGQGDVNTVQSGVMLLIRNVVKDWIRDAHPRTAPLSLQSVFAHGATLESCLPAESAEDGGALRSWMEEQLQAWRSELSDVEQVMLAIRSRGWIFSSPQAVAAAGVGKSTLHKAHREVLIRWADVLRGAHPDVEAEQASQILLDAMDRLGESFLHLLPENSRPAAFGEVKETHNEDGS